MGYLIKLIGSGLGRQSWMERGKPNYGIFSSKRNQPPVSQDPSIYPSSPPICPLTSHSLSNDPLSFTDSTPCSSKDSAQTPSTASPWGLFQCRQNKELPPTSSYSVLHIPWLEHPPRFLPVLWSLMFHEILVAENHCLTRSLKNNVFINSLRVSGNVFCACSSLSPNFPQVLSTSLPIQLYVHFPTQVQFVLVPYSFAPQCGRCIRCHTPF